MTNDRFTLVPAVYLILKKGDQVLLSLRQNTGYADGLYGLVAGHLDGGESATFGLRREVREEIGLEISDSALKMALTIHRRAPQREAIDLFFVAEYTDETITNLEPEKCAALEFFALDALPQNIIPYIRQALSAYEQGISYLEYGWDDIPEKRAA